MKPVIKAVPNTCLDVSGTTTSNAVVVPSDSVPGKMVDFDINYDVMNNCTNTVGGIVIDGVPEGVCAGQGISLGQKDSFDVLGNLASEQHTGNPDTHEMTVKCVTYVNNVPMSSAAPLSLNLAVSAKGTDAMGTSVGSLTIPVAVKW